MSAAEAHPPNSTPCYPDGIPDELKRLPQWVGWRYETKPNGKRTKVPINVNTGARASTTDASTWVSFPRAIAYYNTGHVDGIGFVFTRDDPYIGLDRDGLEDGDPFGLDSVVDEMNTYGDISPSGIGTHHIGKGKLPTETGRHPKGLGIFEHSRFFTMTGNLLNGEARPIRNVQHVIDRHWDTWFPAQPVAPQGPTPAATGDPIDDDDVLSMAMSAKNGGKFRALWDGETGNHGGDESAADLALMNTLRFWTRGDAAQMERLFSRSALGKREKWTSRAGYRESTIARALDTPDYYTPRGTFRLVQGGRSSAAQPPPDMPVEPPNDEDVGGSEAKSTVVEKTLELLAPVIRERWHTSAREPMLTIQRQDGIEIAMSLLSSDTMQYLSYVHYLATKKPISDATQKAVLGLLSMQALYEGDEHPVYSRIAHHQGRVYVDLGDDLHRAVCIDPATLPLGWAVIDSADVPVRFRRSKSALALPLPVQGVSLDALRLIFPNVEDGDWILIAGWLVGVFQEYGGRAFLELLGGQGTGKSTLGRCLIALVDPNEAPMRSMPKTEQDLLISVLWRSVAGLDNVSMIIPEMADALCRISTGAGISSRTLYKDAEETVLRAQLPIVTTAIEPQAVRRPDLQDRTITLRLESLGDDAVRGEREIAEAFEDIRPDLLGALYTAVAVALSRIDTMAIDRLPRLADFATWVEASAPAFGWDEGTFIDVLESSRAVASAMAVDASPIGPLIVAFMKERTHWDGTSSDLLIQLKQLADEDARRARSFPKDATRFAGQLRRMVQPLKAVGIWVGFDRSGRSRGVILDRNDALYGQPDAHGESEPDRPAATAEADVQQSGFMAGDDKWTK